jgi:hypothetical protein
MEIAAKDIAAEDIVAEDYRCHAESNMPDTLAGEG